MLMATKECLESIKGGSIVGSHCSDARSRVRSLMTSAAAADRLNSGARSVDDELADMDKAIEEAASQIEVGPLSFKLILRFYVSISTVFRSEILNIIYLSLYVLPINSN